MNRRCTLSQALTLSLLVTLAACGGGASASSASTQSASAASASAGSAGALDRCALLTDGEITDAIGAHEAGHVGLPNQWGNQSCRWTATAAQQVEEYPNGWHDAIELMVFEGPKATWSRELSEGEPVSGVADGARYDKSYGDLWFPCAGDRVCAVEANTSHSAHRQEIATHLAQLVVQRLH